MFCGDADFIILQTYNITLKVFFHRSFFPIHTYLRNQLIFSGKYSELTKTLKDLECMIFLEKSNYIFYIFLHSTSTTLVKGVFKLKS